MDATQVILRDHREVEKLFKELERGAGATDPRRRGELVRALVRELAVHAVIEEQLVYPALREAGADERVLDALEEHHAVKLTLWELERLPPASERFAAKVRLLATSVRAHVDEEERELLPLLERTLEPGPRRELGAALERARRAAPTRPHPAAPDTPPGNYVVGAFAAVYDRSRDALREGMVMLRTLAAQAATRGLQGAMRLAEGLGSWGRGTLGEAVEQGRVAVESAARRSRELASSTLETAGRLEVRGEEAAREVRRTGRAAARGARQGARAARRDYRAGATGGRAGKKRRRR